MTVQSHRFERGWVAEAVVAGLVGTAVAGLVVLLGYVVAASLADAPAPIGAAFRALAANAATRAVAEGLALAALLHFAVGLGLAVVYASAVEPWLSGPGWRRGVLFALVPWLLSVVVILPLLGGGPLGLGLGAGVLPALGNLIAHLSYGGVLGWVYERGRLELRNEDEASVLANLGAERGIAVGAVGGAVVGAVLAGAMAPNWFAPGTPVAWAATLGAVGGALLGGFTGSYLGVGRSAERAG
jgi:hypothetical protein